jgi:hypothetical protein
MKLGYGVLVPSWTMSEGPGVPAGKCSKDLDLLPPASPLGSDCIH